MIRYYDEDVWKKYFGVDVAELYSSIEGLLILRDKKLVQELTSDTVCNLISRSDIYKEMLFGGFRPDESKPFYDNALALFYRNVLGIGLKNEEISLVTTRLKEGLTLEQATEDIHCSETSTPILELLRDMSSKLKAVYKNLRGIVEEPKPKEYEVKSSTIGLEAFLDVLNAGKKLLPLYNPLSFFIMSIYSVPRFYVAEIYDKLFEENTRTLLRKYGINIVKLLEPDLPDEKIRSEREIIGLEENSVGWLIREVILDIYSLFQNETLKRFFTIEDEFNKYVKTYATKLKESIVIERFKHVISIIQYAGYILEFYDSRGRCRLRDYKFYISRDYRGKVVGGEVRLSYEERYSLNYTEFFAFLAPQMFLGLAYVRPISIGSKEFVWLCLLGWEK